MNGPIRAGMFNLGYMPGSGNKALTTMRETTLPAVEGALSMLGRDSILLVAVYPGHPEGAAEGEALQAYFATLSRYRLSIAKFPDAQFSHISVFYNSRDEIENPFDRGRGCEQ